MEIAHSLLDNPIVLGMVYASFIEQIKGLSKQNKTKFFALTKKLIDPLTTEGEEVLITCDMVELLDYTLIEGEENVV